MSQRVLTVLVLSCVVLLAQAQFNSTMLKWLKAPKGFKVSHLAAAPFARQMVQSESGTLFVGSMAIPDGETPVPSSVWAFAANASSKSKELVGCEIATNYIFPAGVALANSSLYFSAIVGMDLDNNINGHSVIFRIDDVETDLCTPKEPVPVFEFPELPSIDHSWKFLRWYKNLLWVAVGSPGNTLNESLTSCAYDVPDGNPANPPDCIYGTLNWIDLSVPNPVLNPVARGIRNTVGFDWSPADGSLWFTDNGRDQWYPGFSGQSNDIPPDELNHIGSADVLNYGFPLCYGNQIADPTWNPSLSCDGLVPAAVELAPHAAAVGMRFYTAKKFPGAYRSAIFIAEHGSWDSTVPHGYQVVTYNPAKDSQAKAFLTGFVQLPKGFNGSATIGVSPYAWGRPSDVLVANDGSLLIADDLSGNIWRVTYSPKEFVSPWIAFLVLGLVVALLLLLVVLCGILLLPHFLGANDGYQQVS